MKPGNIPESFNDLLTLARQANSLTFAREGNDLTIYLDDIPADRRTVINCRLHTLRVEVKTLCQYDKTLQRWGEYCQPAGYQTLPDKRGEKALRAWLAEKAQEKTFCPNPAFFSWNPMIKD